MQPWQVKAHALEQQFGIPEGLYVALIRQESGGNPAARSPVGAIGYAQLMPATAKGLGVNPHNPEQNLRGGAMYLSQNLKRFGGDINKTLAAYNAGPGAVQKYNGIPPYAETQNYVKKVNQFWKEARKGRPMAQAGMGTGQAPAAYPAASLAPQGPPPDATKLSNQINRINYAYMDAPDLAAPHIDKLTSQYGQQMGAYQQSMQPKLSPEGVAQGIGNPGSVAGPGAKGYFRTPNGLVQNRRAGEAAWQFYQRLGQKGFGLQNDPGNTQTTGGRHSANSLHYAGQAVDFGDAKNPYDKIQSFYDWLKPRKQSVGYQELIWQAPDHYDHLHVGGSGPKAPPSIKPSNSRRRPVKSRR